MSNIRLVSGEFDRENLKLCCENQKDIVYVDLISDFVYQGKMDKIKNNSMNTMEIISILALGEVVGYIILIRNDTYDIWDEDEDNVIKPKSISVLIVMHSEYRYKRNGIALQAMKLLLESEYITGYNALIALIRNSNHASQKLFINELGFKETGEKKSDYFVYSYCL